ncbi:MAG: ribokinase [Rectinema sp.]
MKTVVNSRVLGIGHAMCDIVVELEIQAWNVLREKFPRLATGEPSHVDVEEAHIIFSYFEERAAQGQGNISCTAGGSALNAVRVASLLGTKAAFAGCVGNDECGDVIRASLTHAKVESFLGIPGGQGSTGMFCTISPGSKSMPGQNATEEAVSERIIIASPSVARRVRDLDFDGFDIEKVELIHAEGLLADSPRNLEQFFQRAHGMKKMISIDAVSSEAAKRNKDTLKRLIQRYADFVFCNKSEFEALDVNIANYRSDIVWVIKADRAGVDCFASGQRIHADAPQCTVVDDLGAGDAFAGACLSGILAGLPLDRSLQLGTKAAACALQSRGTEPDEHCLRALSQDILAE